MYYGNYIISYRTCQYSSFFSTIFLYNDKCMAKFGAHLSISGGYIKAVERIVEYGGDCLQIFSSSPRMWNDAKITKDQKDMFLSVRERWQIDPIYFHAVYLVNLADSGLTGERSVQSLVFELQLASELQIRGSIVHLGSFLKDENAHKYDILLNRIQDVLKRTPRDTLFIIENAGTRKIGKSLDEVARIVRDLKNDRVRVCLDTCHLFATGYDLSTQEKLDSFLDEFEKKIGLSKLEVWHVNDSRDTLGSYRDRHENIGEGNMPTDVFRLLLHHEKTKGMPFIIETPGFDQKGPDKKNLDILKGYGDMK